jgi:hypothetical protein
MRFSSKPIAACAFILIRKNEHRNARADGSFPRLSLVGVLLEAAGRFAEESLLSGR